jgi:cytochrome o ubiquinol oxidase subunit 2
VSLDWKWLFIYPDQKVATVNTLTVPVGAPLQFQLTSASVMNAFFIPQFGSMICTMNGMATRLNLRANDPGTFQGLSTQFSGDGFSDMHFDVHCVMAAASPSTAASLRMSRRWSRSPSLMTDMFRFHASIWPSIAAWP